MSVIYTMPGHLIRRLQQISVSVFTEHMKALGHGITSPQFAALSMLQQHPRIDQATLAGLIAYDRPTIGGVVDRLVSKGFVARQTNPKDRRAKVLTLTDAGAAQLAKLTPVVEKLQTAILPGLNNAEYQEFVRLATKVAEAGNDLSRAPLSVQGAPKRSPDG